MNLRHPARGVLVLLLLTGALLLGVYLLRGVLLYPHLKRAAVDASNSTMSGSAPCRTPLPR